MAVPAASRLPERLRRAARPDRYPQPTEAALYFSVLEALQNVANYAHASQARVTLGQDGPSLVFTVEDDGTGFDPATTPMGIGLQGIADRLAALGGTIEITSAPGRGTRVTGQVSAAGDDSSPPLAAASRGAPPF